jgi:acetylglutamate kinase
MCFKNTQKKDLAIQKDCVNCPRFLKNDLQMIKNQLIIIKIGGNVTDNEETLSSVLNDFSKIPYPKILVHGGGNRADSMCKALNIVPKKIEGRRITDAATLDVVTMVYAGLINKTLTARLQALNCNAIGLTGADLNLIQAHKRVKGSIDYGFVGDIDTIGVQNIDNLLKVGFVPVFAPITHDKKGQLLNTNADTIASELAVYLSQLYQITLIYCFDKPGVLLNPSDENSVIPKMNYQDYQYHKTNGSIAGGMIPKLDNAFKALTAGVERIVICGTKGIALRNDALSTPQQGTILTIHTIEQHAV